MLTTIKKFWFFIVAFLFPEPITRVTGPIETAGVIDDNNVPAFQSGVITMAAGTGVATGVYLTPKSWIGLTRLTFPASAADAGELKVNQPTSSAQVDGYGNGFTITSTDADDAGLVSYVIITGLVQMGDSLPVAIT